MGNSDGSNFLLNLSSHTSQASIKSCPSSISVPFAFLKSFRAALFITGALRSLHMATIGISVVSRSASFMIVIFWSDDGVFDWISREGGPIGGNGLEEMETAAGLRARPGEAEHWLEHTDGGFERAMVLRSAASRVAARATDIRGPGKRGAEDSALVKVRV